MSERIQNLLAQALIRIVSSKAFWAAIGCILSSSAVGLWYAARTYYVTLDGQKELLQLRSDHNALDKRVIRLEVKAGIADGNSSSGIATQASNSGDL